MAMCSYKHSFSPHFKMADGGRAGNLFAAGAAVAQDPVPQAAPPRLNLLPPPAGAITLGAGKRKRSARDHQGTGFLRHAPFAFILDRSSAGHWLRP